MNFWYCFCHSDTHDFLKSMTQGFWDICSRSCLPQNVSCESSQLPSLFLFYSLCPGVSGLRSSAVQKNVLSPRVYGVGLHIPCQNEFTNSSHWGALVVKNPPANVGEEMWVQFSAGEDPLEKGMATSSSILAWRVPWTEESGRLQSIGFQTAGHDWSDLTCMHACPLILISLDFHKSSPYSNSS